MLLQRKVATPFTSSPCAKRAAVPRPICIRQQPRTVCMAAAGSDPYKILGIDRDADTNAINRAYSQKKYAARGNDALTAQIEQAHSQLMMSALSARLKNKGKVSKDVAYADNEPLFPWRPKRWDATPKVIMIIGALQLTMTAYGFQAPNMSKVVGAMLIGIAGNVLKQNALFPPPKDPSMASEEESGRAGRNFVRGALLGVGATFLGVLIFGAPEYIANYVKLPPVMTTPGLIVSLKIAGAALTNWIMTSFYY
eukprot:GHUV01002387.1.p1 GENE.GHUV01002387.1~~GHUV01002387.1.p1  ORF type:complete len:253 (+),score=40.80 GHUV01002387.1:166-924(+)